MKWRMLLTLLLMPVLARPGAAGIFGKKPTPPNPVDRVPELINTLKTDGDENKRVAAAEELRQYDPTAYPQIVPALIDVLQADKKPGVRVEAAQTLGKLRPISQTAGQALEVAREKDPSMRVRMQARHSLLLYHWAGYHGSKSVEPPLQTKEPPAEVRVPPPPPPIRTQPGPGNATRPPKGQTAEPPLAPPTAATQDRPPPRLVPTAPPGGTTTTGYRLMPSGSTATQVWTTEPPLAAPLPPQLPMPLPMPLPLSPDPRSQPAPVPGPAPDQTGPDLGPSQ